MKAARAPCKHPKVDDFVTSSSLRWVENFFAHPPKNPIYLTITLGMVFAEFSSR
jgi:hypothetical protein